jgi:cbb3-type cytochrome oxidase maturation protein
VSVIIILISISIIIAIGFLTAFMWSMKSGQYDDTYSPSVRMLFDNKPKKEAEGKQVISHLNLERNDSRKRKK